MNFFARLKTSRRTDGEPPARRRYLARVLRPFSSSRFGNQTRVYRLRREKKKRDSIEEHETDDGGKSRSENARPPQFIFSTRPRPAPRVFRTNKKYSKIETANAMSSCAFNCRASLRRHVKLRDYSNDDAF